VRRYLEFQAYEVQHIQNITDVDDDMVRVSRERGLSIAALTEENHAIHLREMDALHVLRPTAFPRASEYIDSIVAMVEELVARGHAYEVEGHVFFSAASAEHFGELAGCTPAELRAAPRTDSMPQEPEHLKRDPLDFLLWRPGTEPGASFESPWGPGRPGWHVECSAMARATLGEQIDIHGGGTDLIYPHHESEIAQSEGATGRRPFTGTWMHIGTMQLRGVKMSKSLGNLVKVSELLERGHSADALRLLLLSQRYREDHDFDEGALAGCEEQIATLRRALAALGGPPDALRVQPWRNAFMEAMDDDFNTPRAIGVLAEIAEGLLDGRLHGETAVPTLRELGGVLGLELGAGCER
jgi:cysteinyl-tRNA synthetase